MQLRCTNTNQNNLTIYYYVFKHLIISLSLHKTHCRISSESSEREVDEIFVEDEHEAQTVLEDHLLQKVNVVGSSSLLGVPVIVEETNSTSKSPIAESNSSQETEIVREVESEPCIGMKKRILIDVEDDPAFNSSVSKYVKNI